LLFLFDKYLFDGDFFHQYDLILIFQGDETNTTTLAGLLTTGYSNDITKNNADSKATSRESRGRLFNNSSSIIDLDFHDPSIIGRSVGGGPMRSRRNIDTSPYSNNTAYLSPPQESSWRRTSSDSAIHQSLQQNQVRIS
jgi:hypothetical protein